MYSESDIEAAVASGALTPEAARALRDSVARTRATPAVDEESFRLVTGFNDIFVTIAALLLLVAVGWIGGNAGYSGARTDPMRVGSSFALAGLFVAAASWGLAEYFTRVRRMALPSIVLLASFVYGVAACLFGLLIVTTGETTGERTVAAFAAASALMTAGAAWLHWRRFHVPITIAALTAALAVSLLALLMAFHPEAVNALSWIALLAGLAIFAFAMWWDMSDRARLTRWSDVAFWLHLTAAPMIAHPVFHLLGVMDGTPTPASALIVIALYLVFGVIALAIDRRALLVSSLVYVLLALGALFRAFGAIGLAMALTALVIGSVLLMLSAFWHDARRIVVRRLPPALADRLPALDRAPVSPRPA